MDAQLFTLLVGTALLGLRHGIDWDHVAALLDIVGGLGPCALWPALSYALGHALVVALLGVCALQFSAILPEWIDPIMQRLVGGTLVLLSIWVFYQLLQSHQQRQPLRPVSRGLLLWQIVGGGNNTTYDQRAAFSIGMLHGIGAETGSQVLLLTAVGRAASPTVAFLMLGMFVFGLVVSNMIVAWLAVKGMMSAKNFQPVYTCVAVLAAVFGLVVGLCFVIGRTADLPNLSSFPLNFFAARVV
jgi:high-affinity nickel permease